MTEVTSSAAAGAAEKKRPEKPDAEAYQNTLNNLEKEHKDVMDKYNAVKAKIELTQPNKNKDTQNPTEKRRQELIAKVNDIRSKQGAGKTARNSKMDQIKRLEEQLRSRINEQKNARGKVPFKSAEDVDREIERLEKQVNGGLMKLVDEKKALTEISNMRKQRKNFVQFDDAQKGIDDLRAKIKEIKDSMDDPEARALSEEYNKAQTELDEIKAVRDEAYKSLNSLRDERSKLQAEQQEKYQAIRKLKDEYHAQKKAAAEYEREARNRARERQKAERERYEREKKKERAQKMLQEASDPAYLDEIRAANNLLGFFDPSFVAAEKSSLSGNKGMAAEATRKVDDSAMKGMKVISKKDNDEDYMPAVKKGKKGKKGGASTNENKGFNCPPIIIEQCAKMNITPPMSAADVPKVIEEVKKQLDVWKSDQRAQTERNIEKAKKEIERLEAEEAAENSGSATPNGVNGDKKADDKVAAVTSELKEASLEDKKD